MWNIIQHKNLLSRIKMGKVILTFADIKIEKSFTATKLLSL